MKRMNFGSGYDIRPDWVNVDKLDYGPGTVVADVLAGLPFPDDHFDYLVANHSLQMLDYNELPVALAELKRVLRPGGVLRVLVPDLNLALAALKSGNDDWFPIGDDLEPTIEGKFARYTFWHGHARSCFGESSLQDLLHRCGFSNAAQVDCGYSLYLFLRGLDETLLTELDSREKESLIVEATT